MIDLLRRLDNFWDQLRQWLRIRLGWGRRTPLAVVAYRGFGRPDHISLQGRVLAYKPLYGPGHNSRWKSFVDTYRRFETDEIPDAHLRVAIGAHHFDIKTDEEGFFSLDAPMHPPLDNHSRLPWRHADIKLLRTPWGPAGLSVPAEVLIPSPGAAMGIISDIDDTILQTHVTSILKLKMLYYTLFKNAANRHAFHEVAAFYQALHRFPPGDGAHNPFFYVSNSPWNLYDLLQEFLALNHLPKGPILLRDVGIPRDRPTPGQPGHKYRTVRRLLLTYPDLPFLLIGDSGERDADIYLAVAREFPQRIRGIYIRDVRSHRRAQRIASLIRSATNVDIQLIHHYRDAAAHAARRGLIDPGEFEKWRTRLEK